MSVWFSCSKPIALIWPVTWVAELPNAFLRLYDAPAQVGAAAAASWEISWRDIFVCSSSAELIEGGLVHGVAAARFSDGFQKVFQNCDVVSAVAGVRELCEQ